MTLVSLNSAKSYTRAFCIHLCLILIISSVAQSCLTLCDPMDCSPSGSSVHRILQARILEWAGDLPDPGIKPASLTSPALQVDSLPTELSGKPFLFLKNIYLFGCTES